MAHDGAMETNTTPHETPTTPTVETKRLERPLEGRVLAGVAAGLADHTGISVGMIRLGFLVATLFGGLGIILYAAAWALLPNEGEAEAPVMRWLDALRTPGKRTGAVLIGFAALIIVAGAAPVSVVAAALLLFGVAAINRPNQNHQ